jgi:5-enolpyruvylshikimate-3-phosphate synthase
LTSTLASLGPAAFSFEKPNPAPFTRTKSSFASAINFETPISSAQISSSLVFRPLIRWNAERQELAPGG